MAEELQRPDTSQSVLIVDEDEVVLRTLTLQLQDRGWDVLTAESSTKARQFFHEHPTTIALISISLSDMNGLELSRALRQQVPDLIVILMTGYPTLDVAIEGLHYDAYDYLVKPFRIEQLMMVIERARRVLALIRENRELKRTVAGLQAELERMAQPPEPVEEEPMETGVEEEIPLGSTPYADYRGKASGGGTGAIASYERQMRPAPPEFTEEEPTGPPEGTDQEEEQPQPSGQ